MHAAHPALSAPSGCRPRLWRRCERASSRARAAPPRARAQTRRRQRRRRRQRHRRCRRSRCRGRGQRGRRRTRRRRRYVRMRAGWGGEGRGGGGLALRNAGLSSASRSRVSLGRGPRRRRRGVGKVVPVCAGRRGRFGASCTDGCRGPVCWTFALGVTVVWLCWSLGWGFLARVLRGWRCCCPGDRLLRGRRCPYRRDRPWAARPARGCSNHDNGAAAAAGRVGVKNKSTAGSRQRCFLPVFLALLSETDREIHRR